MTVLLVHPPSVSATATGSESFIAGQKRRLGPAQYYSLPIEHLGIMSIAAYARAAGVPVRTVNGLVAGHASVTETWLAIRGVAERFGTPELIGFTTVDTFAEVLWLADRCRREWDEVTIALGGTFATLNHGRILTDHPAIDVVVVGDGEVAFTRLAEAVLDGKPFDDVPALATRRADGTTHRLPPSTVELDELPLAARDDLPTVLGEGFAAAVSTTRGCLYRCTFCGTGAVSDLLGRNSYRARAIERVVDEISTSSPVRCRGRLDRGRPVPKHPRSQQRATAFADEMIRRGLRVHFMFDARADSIGDLALLTHLHKAGLRRVFVGLETGSYRQLVRYRKRHIRAGQDPAARFAALGEIGVEVVPGTIMFHPEVDPAELRATLRLLIATGYQVPSKLVDRVVAYPGTPLYREYADKGYLTENWPVGEWDFVDPVAGEVFSGHRSRRRGRRFGRRAVLWARWRSGRPWWTP